MIQKDYTTLKNWENITTNLFFKSFAQEIFYTTSKIFFLKIHLFRYFRSWGGHLLRLPKIKLFVAYFKALCNSKRVPLVAFFEFEPCKLAPSARFRQLVYDYYYHTILAPLKNFLYKGRHCYQNFFFSIGNCRKTFTSCQNSANYSSNN